MRSAAAAGTLGLADARHRGAYMDLVGLDASSVTVEAKPLTQVLAEQGVDRIDALKIDVEGVEDRILLPFFKSAPESLFISSRTARAACRPICLPRCRRAATGLLHARNRM